MPTLMPAVHSTPAGEVRARSSSSAPYARPNASDSHKKASAVTSYFRDTRFLGKKDQSIRRTLRDYSVCAGQFELSPAQKKLFFVNAFGGSARDFFFDNCRDDMDFDTLASVMVEEYDSDARQLAVHSELDRITLARVMSDDDINDLDTGLTTVVEKINVLTPQCPAHFRANENKLRFLRNAVIREEWAQPAISQITTARFSYNALVTALREQLQLCEEKKELLMTPHTLYDMEERSKRSLPRLHNSVLPTTSDAENSGTSRKKNPIGHDEERMLCKLCAADDHLANDCKAGLVKQGVQDKLDQGIPAVHVLSELVSEIDSDYRQADVDGPTLQDSITGYGNDLLVFKKLMNKADVKVNASPAAKTTLFQVKGDTRATNNIASVFSETSAEERKGQQDLTVHSLFQ